MPVQPDPAPGRSAVDGLPGRHVPRMDAVRVPGVERHPSRASLLTEVPRAGLDVAALAAAWPLLATARAVTATRCWCSGLTTGDPATVVLRTALRALGHT